MRVPFDQSQIGDMHDHQIIFFHPDIFPCWVFYLRTAVSRQMDTVINNFDLFLRHALFGHDKTLDGFTDRNDLMDPAVDPFISSHMSLGPPKSHVTAVGNYDRHAGQMRPKNAPDIGAEMICLHNVNAGGFEEPEEF